jgi:hypothetical protein
VEPTTPPGTPAREIEEIQHALRALPARPPPEPAALPSGLRVSVASPCAESWDAMLGDDRVRHCSRCDRDVFNLSALRADEIEALLAERGVQRCVRFFRRADGTMLTADCPVNRPRRIALRVLAVTAVAVGTSAAVAYYTRPLVRGHADHASEVTGGLMPTS